jgi:NAD-dependent dihydropyrimidine dehydrogenase PreA subunit
MSPEHRRQRLARRLLRPGRETDRAEHGGRDRARPADRRPADQRHRRHGQLARCAGLHRAGRRQRAGVHRRHGLRFQDRAGDGDGLSNYMDEMGFTSVDQIVGKALPTVTHWQYLNLNHISKAVINQDTCIQCGRCHIACEDTSTRPSPASEGRQAPFRGERRRMRGLQPVRHGLPGARMHHPAQIWLPAKKTCAPAQK